MVKYLHMNKNLILGISYGFLLSFIVTRPAFAAVSCYGTLDGDPPKLGVFLPCFLEQTWKFIQKIMVAIALIMGMFLVYKTFTNRENPKALEEIPMRWMYMIVFIFLAFGAGGTLLNFVFKLFGFGTLNNFITPLNDLFAKWAFLVDGF